MSIPLMEIEVKVIEALREELKRNQWCEEMKAKVEWEGHIQQWAVYFTVGDVWRYHHDPDRNTAIDKARGVK